MDCLHIPGSGNACFVASLKKVSNNSRNAIKELNDPYEQLHLVSSEQPNVSAIRRFESFIAVKD